jgi:hypothetical protein
MRRLQGIAGIALMLVHGPGMCGDIKPYQRGSPGSDDQLLVGVECNRSANVLRIGLFDAHHVPDQPMDMWDTFDLKKNNANGDAVAKVLSVERRCDVGRHRYRIRITGTPGNWSLNGQCGGLTYARAKVWKNGAVIFDEDLSSCKDGHALKLVTFSPDSDATVRKKGESLSDLFR